MDMKNSYKRTISFVLALIFILPASLYFFDDTAEAYSPPVDNVRVGLYYGSGALEGANLENTAGYGSGYEFGYFDSRNNFVSIGAYTDDITISMILDRNMFYNSSTRNYETLGTSSQDIVVGCYHIQLSTVYSSFEAAKAAANTFTSVHAFPKYYNDKYYVCAGNYTSKEAAEAAAETLSIRQEYTITSGTSSTITVVDTGTSNIILEFDCGTSKFLGVKPMDSERPITWFKQVQYYGMFQYRRINGGNITVSNVVDIEDYVKCSIPYEMISSWPIEALKAQAVTARTYVMMHLNAHSSNGFDVCDTACCQMYNGIGNCTSNTDRAVDETKSQYLTYNGKLCDTFYYSSNGGATENCENIWVQSFPYLIGKLDPYETAIADSIPSYRYTYTFTGAELTYLLQNKGYSCSNIVSCEITEFTEVGNVYKVTFTDDTGRTFTFSKSNAKVIFGAKSQRFTITNSNGGSSTPGGSSNIYVDSDSTYISGGLDGVYAIGGQSDVGQITDSGEIYAVTDSGTQKIDTSSSSSGGSTTVNDENTVYTISGAGNGHNVGMSQYGAYSMASKFGMDFIDILTFYYDGSEILTAE